MINQYNITVWEYNKPITRTAPKRHDVLAWCVGGDEGVFALWEDPKNPKLFYEAHGDDGSWWLVGHHGKDWAEKIIEAYQEIAKRA